jgi:glycerol-3-phosphate acyltransferase PlsY
MTFAAPALWSLAAYLVGSVPFGYLIARLRGVDILHQGSGNIGATNVGRLLGRRLGILVFALDFLKGAVPAAVARAAGGDELGVLAGLAAFLGHLFPVYLRFRGGKGVATGFGAMAVLVPGPAAVAVLVWLSAVGATRVVSVASLGAAFTLAAARLLLTPEPFAADNRALTGFCLAGAALIVVRHRANMVRLAHGTENRLRETPLMRQLVRTLHVLSLALWLGSTVFFTFIAAPLIFQSFEASSGKEEGSRLAGIAVGPIFPPFFLLQGLCGLVAAVTAMAWARRPERVHRLRFVLAAAALATVLVGWPIAQRVAKLRTERSSADAVVAEPARQAFAGWHLASLGLEFVTILLVGVVTALAARLPDDAPLSRDPKGSA